MRKLTLEQLSHLKIVPLFFPDLVTLIPALLSSAFAIGAKDMSSGTTSSSLDSTFGEGPDAIRPLADVNEVAAWGTPGGGGEPERESVAREDNVAAALCNKAGLETKCLIDCDSVHRAGSTHEGRLFASLASLILRLACPVDDIRRCLSAAWALEVPPTEPGAAPRLLGPL